MITFDTQEDFEKAVMDIISQRLKVGVTVSKERPFYDGTAYTKVSVSLFDAEGGDNIDSGSDYA